MPGKRANNGFGPGKVVKSISGVGMTRRLKARLSIACDKYDATEGWVVEQALEAWLNWKQI